MQGKGFLIVFTVRKSAWVPTYGPVGPPVEFSVMCVEINLLTYILFHFGTSLPPVWGCNETSMGILHQLCVLRLKNGRLPSVNPHRTWLIKEYYVVKGIASDRKCNGMQVSQLI